MGPTVQEGNLIFFQNEDLKDDKSPATKAKLIGIKNEIEEDNKGSEKERKKENQIHSESRKKLNQNIVKKEDVDFVEEKGKDTSSTILNVDVVAYNENDANSKGTPEKKNDSEMTLEARKNEEKEKRGDDDDQM